MSTHNIGLRFFRLVIIVLLAFLPSGAEASFPLVAADLPDLVEKVLPGVVNVSSTSITHTLSYGMDEFMQLWGVPREQKHTSLGSGFIINSDGYCLTNFHVVEDATEVSVILVDKRQFRAKIIGKDQKMDLALLQIRDKDGHVPPGLVALDFADSDRVRIAEAVFAVGNPFGLQHTVTMGIISAKNRTIGIGPFDNFLQTDASINPGNSGGPLFNLKGQVVGINTVIYSRTGQSGGLGFAIPSNEAKKIIPELQRYGRVPRPWLGILGQPMTGALAEYVGTSAEKGVLVYNLVQNAPSQAAGIRQGDVITSLDQIEVVEPNDLEKILAKHHPKDKLAVEVRRRSHKMHFEVKLDELPRTEKLPPGIF